MTVHIDISQLVLDPRRTGIQRAERELIRLWPGPAPLQACRFDAASGELHELPNRILSVLCEDAPPGGIPADLARLRPYLRNGRVVRPRRLLNVELFSDPDRAAFYGCRVAGRETFWLLYDFLPWLQPRWFGIGSAAPLMPYLRALRSVDHVAFISEQTKTEYVSRIARRASDGPVVPLGGDGLGLERQEFRPERRGFVMLGTIEPRKNASPVMRAFMELWAAGADARLVMIGQAAPDAEEELHLLQVLVRETRFELLHNLPDAGVRDVLRGARMVVFPSVGEGFGIPPMEALHAGIPVLVSADLPALAGQPSFGQMRLDPPSAEAIAGCVGQMLDDGFAGRLWAEAAQMVVPGWADFARRVGAWAQG